MIASVDDNFNNLGFAIIGIFLAAWVLSYLVYRVRKIDRLEVQAAR